MDEQEATGAIKKITVVGTGVIGNGWITRYLANGYSVIASDPDPTAEERTREAVEQAWPAMEKVGLHRSEERRVGKEGMARWAPAQWQSKRESISEEESERGGGI